MILSLAKKYYNQDISILRYFSVRTLQLQAADVLFTSILSAPDAWLRVIAVSVH